MKNCLSSGIRAQIDRCYEAEKSGDISGAISKARTAVEQADTNGSDAERAAARVCLAYLCDHLGKFDEALNLAGHAVELSRNAVEVQVDALITKGICHSDLGQIKEAEECLLASIELAREHGFFKAIQRCLHVLSAGVYLPRGQFELAMAADEESLQLAEELELHDARWFPLATLGWMYWITGKRRLAQDTLKRLGDSVQPYSMGEGYYFSLAADIAQDGDQPEMAPALYSKARSIADIIGDPGLGAELRTGLSRYHRKFGSPSTAQRWACDAVNIAEHAHSSPTLGWALVELARCRWVLGDLDGAERAFHRARDHATSTGAEFDLAVVKLLLAAMFYQRQDRAAGRMWVEAVHSARNGGYWFLLERERALFFPLIAGFLNDAKEAVSGASAEVLRQLGQIPPPPLVIVTLGSFEIRQGKRLIPEEKLERRRAGDLLRLVLISSGRKTECNHVMETIWPGKSKSAAKANLHQATSLLRRVLEPDLPDRFPSRYLKVQHGWISLELPDESRVDFERFEELVKRKEYAQAFDSYGGDLFPGNAVGERCVLLRENLKQRAIQAGLKAAAQELETGNFEAALEFCLKILRLEPWQEESVLVGMQALMALGQRAGAIRLYQRLRSTLVGELGIEPQKELQDFCQSILKSS